MKLPNGENAVIAKEKIVRYLLSDAHPKGRHKAAFFSAFGFFAENWEEMEAALLDHCTRHDVSEVIQMPGGIHYLITGDLKCPDGRSPVVCVVWRIDGGSELPRFITAYPD